MKLGSGADPCIFMYNVYTDEELELIQKEIMFLYEKIGPAETTSAATDERGFRKKVGRGVFLDKVYQDRRYSDILKVTRKFFHDKDLRESIEDMKERSIYWRQWDHMNFDSTLLQEYRNGDYYDYHVDLSTFTIVSTFKFGDYEFEGGDLVIDTPGTCGDKKYLHIHNSAVIFPSVVQHAVSQVHMPKLSGGEWIADAPLERRWSVAQLVSYKDLS